MKKALLTAILVAAVNVYSLGNGYILMGPALAQTGNQCPQQWRFVAFSPNGIALPQGPFCTYTDCYRISAEIRAGQATTSTAPTVIPPPTECWNEWAQTWPTPKPTPTPTQTPPPPITPVPSP